VACQNQTNSSPKVHPSTSQNTAVLAQAFRKVLKAGDEIIVTNQDHEANSGVWRQLADAGMVIREWQIDPETGSLDITDLDRLITNKTRLLTFPHCSNVVGEINPVAKICAKAKAAEVMTVVDGVSYAGMPHKQFNPAGPDHAQVAACNGVAEYFDTLYEHHFGASTDNHQRALAVAKLMCDAEQALIPAIIDYLDNKRQKPKYSNC